MARILSNVTNIIVWNIKHICFLDFIPQFINVQNKPKLKLLNNGISTISKEEIKLLKQYSNICLDSNPIGKNHNELLKLKKAGVNFSADYYDEKRKSLKKS